MARDKISIGQKFGKLTVLAKGSRSGEQSFKWECICECGNKTFSRGDHLKSGRSNSCGCMRHITRRQMVENSYGFKIRKHGLYSVWMSMKQRCTDPNCISYKYYGGRGITVCNEWAESYESFYEWSTSNGWAPGLQIDRKQVNGSYCPENCRYVTPQINSNNRRSNVIVNLSGVDMTLSQACHKLGLKPNIIGQRMRRDKMDFQKAISK
jgi:hypothetical protein